MLSEFGNFSTNDDDKHTDEKQPRHLKYDDTNLKKVKNTFITNNSVIT